MRRIKKRGALTATVTRPAAYEKKSDDKELVEEVVTITPEKVTLEEDVKPIPEDVKSDVEDAVKKAEEEEEVAETEHSAAEQNIAEETLGEETGEPCEEATEEKVDAPCEVIDDEKTDEPCEEAAEVVTDENPEEVTEEKIVEDTVTVTPDEVIFDETEKPVDESEQADADEAILKAEADVEEIKDEKIVEDTVTVTHEEVVFDETEKPADESEQADVEESVLKAEEESEEEAIEEVPLEASEEESEEILSEEGSLDGDENEVEELAADNEEAEEENGEEPDENEEEVVAPEVKPEKEVFKLTAPANQDEILANICVKRGRKLIYRPNEILFNCTAAVTGTDKDNEEGIKVKNILDEEIKQGVKLGYIDKYDGLKMSEIKEEYENDVVYEYAEQEFKRTGLVLDGDKIKVYIYDWDMKVLHHVGYVEAASVEVLKPYLADREKYSFDICGLITGGKYRKVIKDEASGKVTVEKGNDGKLGLELDISIINRKD